MPDSCTLIVNPLSGGYSPQKVRGAKEAIENLGMACAVIETRTPEEASLRAGEICGEEFDPLIVVGAGDGTINGVVNGLVPGKATLAVLPFGTSNVLSRELEIFSPAQGIEKIAAGRSRSVSVGLMETGSTSRYFLLMAGIGFDGYVVKGVGHLEKKYLGKGAFVLSTLRQFLALESGRLRIQWESGCLDCHSVIVCNASKYAGNFSLAPAASLFDPHFQVVCLEQGTRASLLSSCYHLLAGKGLKGNHIRTFRASELDVTGTKPIQADGDFYFHAPVHIRTVPDFMRVIV